jgi:enoyl-CoA hydratase/carnithine racemase
MSSYTARPTEIDVVAEARVNVSITGGVGWITLDNPSKLNAISTGMWHTVVDTLEAFEANAAVRCVVFSGHGDKAFCAGADIAEKDQSARDSAPAADGEVFDALAKIRAFPKPTIAMISGYCLGAGIALAVACDLRVASATAHFGIPAAKLGLPYFYAGLKSLADLVGPSTAKRIIFTADRFPAEEALRFRLIDELVPACDLPETVQALASRIVANAPLTIAAAKHAVATAFSDNVDRDLAGDTERERACMESQDYVEGRRAFIEKRPPVFQGR